MDKCVKINAVLQAAIVLKNIRKKDIIWEIFIKFVIKINLMLKRSAKMLGFFGVMGLVVDFMHLSISVIK